LSIGVIPVRPSQQALTLFALLQDFILMPQVLLKTRKCINTTFPTHVTLADVIYFKWHPMSFVFFLKKKNYLKQVTSASVTFVR
jgi:hypothetical protein